MADIFSRFFSDVWGLLLSETNKYAAHFRQSSYTPPRSWHDIVKEEMKAFIGILILLGVCRLPRLKLCWTTNTLTYVKEFTILCRNKDFSKFSIFAFV